MNYNCAKFWVEIFSFNTIISKKTEIGLSHTTIFWQHPVILLYNVLFYLFMLHAMTIFTAD